MNSFKNYLKKYIHIGYQVICFSIVVAVLVPPNTVSAITFKALQDANNYKPWYDKNDVVTSCGTGAVTIATGAGKSDSGIWNSGLAPPYILEQFAIETLKDLAQKEGTDPANAVTEEHVVGLVAFMLGEGGDIMNSDLFNPLNSGINAPDLLAGSNNVSGIQSFKSFDAGVEATARTMETPNQNRLGSVLTKKETTAEQFMQTLTYFSTFTGNREWAGDSLPPKTEKYYMQRLQFVQEVRGQYADIAGLILGTPQKEQLLNLTDKSKLQFHPVSDTGSSSGSNVGVTTSGSCAAGSAGISAGNIIKTALGLAWPNCCSHGRLQSDATPAYQVAMPQYNGSVGSDPFSDCGVFIATVMIASGADTSYQKRGTGAQLDYLSKSSKYIEVPNIGDTSNLQPGDIFIFNAGRDGHTYFYMGPFTGDDGKSYNATAASLGQRVPQANNTYFNQGGNQFHIFRLKG